MISLLIMGQGNTGSLYRTCKSMSAICNEVIFGDMLLFKDDRSNVELYKDEFNMKAVRFEPSYLYHNGFSSMTNELAKHATNEWTILMGIGEMIDEPNTHHNVMDFFIRNMGAHNAFSLNHITDPHRWVRLYKKSQLHWDGMIHEEIIGPRTLCSTPLFCMADTVKDTVNIFKSKVFDDIKEMVYFRQYLNLVEHPERVGITNGFWVSGAHRDQQLLRDKLAAKGPRLEAFINNDIDKYISLVIDDPHFMEGVKTSDLIDYQLDKGKLQV